MVGTPVDQDLTLGDLMAVINEFKHSNRPVTVQTVIAALVARTNAPATVAPSHSERIPVLAALARTNVDSAARLEMNANCAAHLETMRPPAYPAHTKSVPIRAPLAGTNANHAAHHEMVAPEPVPIRVPLPVTNVNHAAHHETAVLEPVPIRAPLAGTDVNHATHHETVAPLYSERVPGRVSKTLEQSTNVQYTAIVTSRRRKRYYAIIVGRQTGVFDDWQIVKELTVQIPNNWQCGFTTEQQAFEYYNLQKDKGKVRVTWLSRAEESRYGPMSVALF